MKKIYVIHENDEWLIPLRESFKKISAPYEEWHMNKVKFDYLEIRDKKNLKLSKEIETSKLFFAYSINNIILIDNF